MPAFRHVPGVYQQIEAMHFHHHKEIRRILSQGLNTERIYEKTNISC